MIDNKIRYKPVTMARKAPTEQQVRDTFQTPRYATELLIPFIPKHISNVWEPAAGDGRIARVLTSNGFLVHSSDLVNSGKYEISITNFLIDGTPEPISSWITDAKQFSIITNPPFSIKDLFIENCFAYNVPFALLINAGYSGWQIDLVKRGCEKIIPTRRIDYITPFNIQRINKIVGTDYKDIDEIPNELLAKYSGSQFHSMWLTYGFGIGRTETFVDLPIKQKKENIK